MSAAAGASCHRCGAVLATDQDYCVECGTRRVRDAGNRWRAPVLAALAVLIVATVIALLGYRHLVDQSHTLPAAPKPGAHRVQSGQ